MEKRFLVIAGPTGCGETTVDKEIIKRFPIFDRAVSATSRKIRSGEKDKIDYYFMSKREFLDEMKKGNIFEHTYISNRNTYYGTYKPDLDRRLAEGKIIIKNPDLVGAKFYKEKYNATTIFLKPESLESLERRIKNRNPEISEEELGKRMENAKEELEEEKYYDYSVVNADGKLEDCVNEIIEILKKENYKFV